MKFHSFCPRCGTEFTQSHFAAGSVVCQCGWHDEIAAEQAAKKIEKKAIVAMCTFAVAFVIGFGHLESWGSHAMSIPFTKAGEMLGLLSPQGYKDLAQTCIDLNKWSCAEDAYKELADAGIVEGLAMLGSLEARLNRNAQAIEAYRAYETRGGREMMSLLGFAKALEVAGQDNEAMRVYEKSIAAKPEALPVQATSGIVRLLMKTGRYAEAYVKIVSFHESAENATGYLNTEMAQLQKQLGDKEIAALEKQRTHKVASF